MSDFMTDHDDLCIGIDLGTTNSVLATANEKPSGDMVSKVIDLSRGVDMFNAVSGDTKLTLQKKPLLPSCIYYREDRNYEPLVGDFAKMQYALRPHLVAKSIKSQMGKAFAEGLAEEIPDKRPAEIAARILQHMLWEAGKIFRREIKDAIITVPANFDSAMCKATLEAAKIAGIKVTNPDGSERAVLLSEPNAVIYDLINQIHNGEISKHIIDLSTAKRVLVFDLGGGTLDITMHDIKRREDAPDVLKVDEIATNRYTLLGGDDFDERIAEAMYRRYISQYSKHPTVTDKLKREKNTILPQLRVFAENLKIELNNSCRSEYSSGYDSGWGDDEEEAFPVGGNMGGVGYAYDDTFTKEEIEQILAPFMAVDLKYDDYRRLESIKDTNNIIYPILDVLKKAAEKLQADDVRVDAVILNGGMSKFYMVIERLKEFFGLEPIEALDPDQAVARGASVYHYYLHKYAELKEDMRLIGETIEDDVLPQSIVQRQTRPSAAATNAAAGKRETPALKLPAIEWGKSILNDDLYLGVKNGGVHKIIPTGAELPYSSAIMTGFSIEPEQSKIAIPIKSRNLDGTYRTISTGNIIFNRKYKEGAYVAFKVLMNKNKVIIMEAWTSSDEAGLVKLETGSTNISIGNAERTSAKMKGPAAKTKFIPPTGSILNPDAELKNLLQLCTNFANTRVGANKSRLAQKIKQTVKTICNAGNREFFADVVLRKLRTVTQPEAQLRLFIIARRIGIYWDEYARRELADICLAQLQMDLMGFSYGGPKKSVSIQALMALSICGDANMMKQIIPLHRVRGFATASLYAHAQTRTELDWMIQLLAKDVDQAMRGLRSTLQNSAHFVGVALMNDGNSEATKEQVMEAATLICQALRTHRLNNVEVTTCLIALGCICDQRTVPAAVDAELLENITNIIRTAGGAGDFKAKSIALKMVTGTPLESAEEQYLLTKLEYDEDD